MIAGLALTQVAMRDSGPDGIIAERLDRIDTAIESEVVGGEIAGAVALIMKGGEVVYHKSFGFADLDRRTAMQTDSIFRIASMTKAITSVAAMMLYERGYFRLNDPVADYIPEYDEMRVVADVDASGNVVATDPALNPIRIIDLMTHTSGIGYPFIPSKLQKTYRDAGVIDGPTVKKLDLASQMRLLAEQPLLFEPGTAFAYGLSTDLLGYLVEVISGRSLRQFFTDEIFKPLGMHDTYFYLPDDKAGRLVTLYGYTDDGGLVAHEGSGSDFEVNDALYPVIGARSYFSGGAGLSSTASDYALFLQMLLNDGELNGVRLLSRKSVELMRTGRVDWDGDDVADFGLGFRVVADLGKNGELASVGSYSWGGAFDTSYWIDPHEDLIGVYMSQARPTQSDMGAKFNTLVYQALE